MLSRVAKISTDNRSVSMRMFIAMALAFFMVATLPVSANANTKSGETEKSNEADGPKVPEIPDTVIVPDSVSLTIVLPKTGTIRQIVLNIWLEAQNKQAVGAIEQVLPKIINAFLVDLQRLMYRDTQQRFENREPGKRSFRYDGPALLPPPPAKTEEELAAEAEAAEKAEESGEMLVKEPPFTPFSPVSNRYFAALQNKLLNTAETFLPPDTIRSVQVRKFYDRWPGDT
ncbi:hypothetical protein ACQ0MK_19045 [Thalassospira lucentensis]|uniref:hypothetical protein n=1 Tax=Thalassospira lucentensis TaxID=168935 RepID=UPI003D2EC9AD